MFSDEEKRLVEMVRQGVQGDFWAWYKLQVQAESTADILVLTDPKTPEELVGFLRGKIRARNDDLLLPQQFIAAYDYVDVPAKDDPDTPGAVRRLSPLVKEDEDVGQPDEEPGQPWGGEDPTAA